MYIPLLFVNTACWG